MDSNGVGANNGVLDYNYSYAKEVQNTQQVVKAREQVPQKENDIEDGLRQKNSTSNVEKQVGVVAAKSLYDENLDRTKKAEEEKKRREDDEQRQERLKELADELNKRINSFSKGISFGVNDTKNSIVVSIMEKNIANKVKELSTEDADKLFRRLDYVLGVLFDNKA